ncbi:MAG: hypothetical protein AAF502_25245 [Bacteroidota bacterium]
MKNESISEKNEVIIVGIILIVIFGNAIITFIAQLLYLVVIGGTVGFIGWLILKNERETGAISKWFSDVFRSTKDRHEFIDGENVYLLNDSEVKLLNSGLNDDSVLEFKDRLEELSDKYLLLTEQYQSLEEQNERLKLEVEDAKKSTAKGVLDYIVGDSQGDYSYSKEIEKRRKREEMKEKEKDLNNRIFQQEIKEKTIEISDRVREVKEDVRGHKYETSLELLKAREERDKMRYEFKDAFVYLDKKIDSVHTYFEEKTNTLKSLMERSFFELDHKINSLETSVQSRFSDVHVKIGNLSVSLEKAQTKVKEMLLTQKSLIDEVRHKVKEVDFRSKMSAAENHLRLRHMDTLLEKTAMREKILKDSMNNYLGEIALHNKSFAVQAQEASMEITAKKKEIEYLAKDVGYKELGIEALRKDFESRVKQSNLELEMKSRELKSMEQLLREKRRNDERDHKLYTSYTSLKNSFDHQKQRNDLLSQELNVVKGLRNRVA